MVSLWAIIIMYCLCQWLSLRLRSDTIVEDVHDRVLLGDFVHLEKEHRWVSPFIASEHYYLHVTPGNTVTVLGTVLHADFAIREDAKDLSS